MGTPRGGTPAWKDFLAECSHFFIARPSPRAQKDIPKYQPEVQLDPNPVRFLFSALSTLGGATAARPYQKEEDTHRASAPAIASLMSLGVGGTGEGEANGASEEDALGLCGALLPWRAAKTTAEQPPPALPSTSRPASENQAELVFGWEATSLRSLWWAATAAGDLRAAHRALSSMAGVGSTLQPPVFSATAPAPASEVATQPVESPDATNAPAPDADPLPEKDSPPPLPLLPPPAFALRFG
ncbi:hypothetical protein ACSSS7_006114 [Eimeria intestinalis]